MGWAVSHRFRRSFTSALPDPSAAAVTAGLPVSQSAWAQGKCSAGWCCSEFQVKFMKAKTIKCNKNLGFMQTKMVGYSWYNLRHYGYSQWESSYLWQHHKHWPSWLHLHVHSVHPSLFEVTLVFFVTTSNFFPGCFELIMLPSVKAVEFIQSRSSRGGSTHLWDICRSQAQTGAETGAGLGSARAPWLPGSSGA